MLVIGGGDGGVARELGYYDEIEQIDVVEPDACICRGLQREFSGRHACGLSDERVTVCYEDGLKFLRMKHDEYDPDHQLMRLIHLDILPGLFTKVTETASVP